MSEWLSPTRHSPLSMVAASGRVVLIPKGGPAFTLPLIGWAIVVSEPNDPDSYDIDARRVETSIEPVVLADDHLPLTLYWALDDLRRDPPVWIDVRVEPDRAAP